MVHGANANHGGMPTGAMNGSSTSSGMPEGRMQDSAQAAATEAHGTGEMPRGEMVSTTAMGMPRGEMTSPRTSDGGCSECGKGQ
jgi:hypothetical protein